MLQQMAQSEEQEVVRCPTHSERKTREGGGVHSILSCGVAHQIKKTRNLFEQPFRSNDKIVKNRKLSTERKHANYEVDKLDTSL